MRVSGNTPLHSALSTSAVQKKPVVLFGTDNSSSEGFQKPNLDQWLPSRESFEKDLAKFRAKLTESPSKRTLKNIAKLPLSLPVAAGYYVTHSFMSLFSPYMPIIGPIVMLHPRVLYQYVGKSHEFLEDLSTNIKNFRTKPYRYESYRPESKIVKTLEQGDVRQAFHFAHQSVQIAPADYWAYHSIGNLAQDLLEDLHGQKFHHGGNHFNLSESQYEAIRKARFPLADIAVEAYQRAAEIGFDHTFGINDVRSQKNHRDMAYYSIGKTYETVGNVPKALEFYQKALEASQTDNQGHMSDLHASAKLHLLQKSGMHTEAIAHIKQTLTIPDAHNGRIPDWSRQMVTSFEALAENDATITDKQAHVAKQVIQTYQDLIASETAKNPPQKSQSLPAATGRSPSVVPWLKRNLESYLEWTMSKHYQPPLTHEQLPERKEILTAMYRAEMEASDHPREIRQAVKKLAALSEKKPQ